jgi:hypothetical protein
MNFPTQIRQWWAIVPIWAKAVLLTALLGVGAFGASRFGHLVRWLWRRRRQKNLEEYALRIDRYMMEGCRGKASMVACSALTLAQHFGESELRTREALALLKAQGKVQSDPTGNMWFVPMARRILE